MYCAVWYQWLISTASRLNYILIAVFETFHKFFLNYFQQCSVCNMSDLFVQNAFSLLPLGYDFLCCATLVFIVLRNGELYLLTLVIIT